MRAKTRYWSQGRKENGAALLEYAILLGLISIICIFSVFRTGDRVAWVFCVTASSVAEALEHDSGLNCQAYVASSDVEAPGAPHGDGPSSGGETPGDDGGETPGDNGVTEDPTIFEPSDDMFGNKVVSEGSSGVQQVFFDFEGSYNSDVQYRVRRLSPSSGVGAAAITPVAEGHGGDIVRGSGTSTPGIWSDWMNVSPDGISRLGVEVSLSADNGIVIPFEVGLRSREDHERQRNYSFDVKRANDEVVFLPDIEVTDFHIPMGAKGPQRITFDLEGLFNSDLEWSVEWDDAFVDLGPYDQVTAVTGHSALSGDGGAFAYSVGLGEGKSIRKFHPSAWDQLKVSVVVPHVIHKEWGGSLKLKLNSADNSWLSETYNIDVWRDPQPVVFDTTGLKIEDRTIPAGTIRSATVLYDLEGTYDSRIEYRIHLNSEVGYPTNSRPWAYPVSGMGFTSTDRANLGESSSWLDVAESTESIGALIDLPYDASLTSSVDLTLEIRGKYDHSTVESFDFTLTRPGM